MTEQRMVPVELLEDCIREAGYVENYGLIRRLRAIIDGPGVEPVAWIHPMDVGRFPSVQFERLNDEMLPLYLASHSDPVARCHECGKLASNGWALYCVECAEKVAPAQAVPDWQPIETAPKDGTPIIGWCVHGADPYFLEVGNRLTLYGAHSEGLSHVEDGPHVVVWGGAFDDRTWEDPLGAHLPDWWFRHGSDFEEAANPICWIPLPQPPATAQPSAVARPLVDDPEGRN